MKNIQVKLTFQADTKAAKQEMASLQQQLSNLAVTPIASAGTQKMRNELQQAANKAVELKVALQNATNVDTGKLNLNKFSQQLKQNKMTLTQYAQELAKLGPQGTQAFLQLTNSIRQAETPMIALTGKVKALTDTLMNTLRWQISSSLITGAISTFTSIIDYSEELNESLNNIRIVTGKNIDQMSKFADAAQKSAKALSSTTTEYTNAALIYYQQGLSDKEVKERTDTTIKLANAVGEEAQTVSEWMTAIWNNFDDGSKSMEYYADVLAKLGAATASSADEIAGGLEKFAAVAETTGLSYEYAAAALATITSETRQSEDVVGTALKTIFARIENLKLGETLEDGLNLGQYSAALEKVGVNILDANGNLKEMDTILDNIAMQWNTLNNAEQVALAQSVAGIRQYNQFLALMGNWDVMEKNVELARDSTGELEKQNLIYSQGIEGATARVQNTLDEIKNTLLDENDLLPLLEIANGFLGVVNDLLDAFGGLPTILLAVTTILTKMYSSQIAGALTSAGGFLKSSAMMLVGKGGDLKGQMTQEAVAAGAKMVGQGEGFASLQESKNLKDSFSSQERLQEAQNSLNASTKQYLELLHQVAEKKREIALGAAEEADKSATKVSKATNSILNDDGKRWRQEALDSGMSESDVQTFYDEIDTQFTGEVEELKDSAARSNLLARNDTEISNMENASKEQQRYGNIFENTIEDLDIYGGLSRDQDKSVRKLQGEKGALTKLKQAEAEMDELDKNKSEFDSLSEKQQKGKKLSKKEIARKDQLGKDLGFNADTKKLDAYDKKMKNLRANQTKYKKTIQDTLKPLNNYEENLKNITDTYDLSDDSVDKLKTSTNEYGEQILDTANSSRDANGAMLTEQEELNAGLERGKGAVESFVSGFGTFAQGAMGLQMLTSGFDSLTTAMAEGDKSFSTWLSGITSILFSITMLLPALQKIVKITKLQSLWDLIVAGTTKLRAKITKQSVKEIEEANKKEQLSNFATIATNIGKLMSKFPVGTIIGAALLTGITAMLVAAGASIFGGLSSSVDTKSAEKLQEQDAQAAEEEYNKTKEQANANKELYNSYFDALKVYQETGKEKEKLAEAAAKIAAAYGIEGAAIASLTGDYDTLTEKIQEAREAELNKTVEQGKRVQNTQQEKLVKAMRGNGDDIGWKDDKGGYAIQLDFGDSGKDGDDEKEFLKIVEDYWNENKETLKEAGVGYNSSKGQFYVAEIDNPNSMAALSIAASDIVSKAQSAGIKESSEGFKGLKELVYSWGEDVTKAQETYTEQQSFKAQLAVTQARSNDGKTVNSVSTLKDYLTLRNDATKGHEEDSDIYKAIVSELGSIANVAEFETIAQAIKTQSSQSNQLTKETLETLYANADSIGIRAMAMVNITEGMTKEQFEQEAFNNRIAASSAELETVAAQYEITAKEAETYANTLKASNSLLGVNAEAANIAAIASIKLNKNIETLTKTWDNNANALSNATFGTSEYAFALAKVAEDLETTFGIKNQNISLVNYLNNNSQLIEEFMNGDLTKLPEIQKGIAEEVSYYYDSFQSEARETDQLIALLTSQDYIVGEQASLGEALKTQLNNYIRNNEGGLAALREMIGTLGFQLSTDVKNKITSITKVTGKENWKQIFDERAKEAQKRMLKLDEEKERYYEINKILEDIERSLTNIGKAKDRAFGEDKLEYIKKEKELLDDQINSYDKKITEIQDNLSKDRAEVLKFGFDIDDSGNVINYDEIYEARLNEYNKAIETASKDEQETIKENWKKFEESLKQYEETINEYEEVRDAKTDVIYEKESLLLEEISTEVEATTNLTERSLNLIDHQLSEIEDDAFAAAEAIALMGKKAEQAVKNSEANRKGISGILGTIGITEKELLAATQTEGGLTQLLAGKKLTADQVDALDTYVDGLYEANDLIKEQYEAVQDKVVEAYEAWNEELGHNVEMLERSQSMLESYRNIIDIVGKDTLGISNEVMDQMSQANVKMAQQSVEMNRTIYEADKKAYEEAKKLYEQGGLSEERFREIEATMLDSQQTFMDSWSSALETAAAEFEGSVERIMEAYDSAMGNLSEKSKWFEKQQTLQDFFLKDYEKTYEISKLNRQISQSINSNDSVVAQRKLRDIQSELLDYQKQGKNISDYDLQYLQKKYDLTIAQNALEDAQNAKSQARLIRDSSGNFGYLYTANQKNIESAQQQFEDKLYAMEQFLDKSQNDLSKQWFELNQQWADEMAALDKNAQDYKQKAADITAYYTELMENVSGEMTDMVQYGMEINQKYGTHAAETFNETILGKMYKDYSNFEQLQAKSTEAMQVSLNNIIEKHSEFKTNIETTMVAAGTNVKDFKDNYVTWMGETEKANADLVQDTANTANKMSLKFTEIINAADKFAKDYNDKLSGIRNANDTLAKSINDLITAYSTLTGKDIQNEVNALLNKTTGYGATGENGSGTIDGNTGFISPPVILNKQKYTVTDTVQPKIGTQYYDYNKQEQDQDTYYKLKGEDGSTVVATINNLRDITTNKSFDKNSTITTGTQVNATSTISSNDFNKSKDTVKISEFQDGTMYAMYKIGDRWYPGSALRTPQGNPLPIHPEQDYKGWEVIIVGNAEEWGEISLANASFSQKNADYITEYDGDATYSIGEDGWLQNSALEKIKQRKVVAKDNNSDVYKLDQYIGLMSEDLDIGFWNEADTKYLNRTDLAQLLQTSYGNFATNVNLRVGSFDTGGYTGSWGPEGRMAMLHQKEIVLNAHDTENFLTAIEIVRSIATQLENNALRTAQGLGSLVTAAAVNNNREILEQNVTIHAEFPNATNHNEIELAFNDLINQASQYVNRR